MTNWVTIALNNRELRRTPAHLIILAESQNRTGHRLINIAVPGCQDAQVADDEQRRGEQHEGRQPVRRHQPRLMSLVAGSLAVAKPRSAPVRRANDSMALS